MSEKQFGEKSVYLIYTPILLFILKEVRTGTEKQGRIWEAGTDGEVRKDAVYWLILVDSLTFISIGAALTRLVVLKEWMF